jgi:hypothetical protein
MWEMNDILMEMMTMTDEVSRDDELRTLYGQFAPIMTDGSRVRSEIRDRSAYVFTTGQFPSHLRKLYTNMISEMTQPFRKPSSLDGRVGYIQLREEIAADLKLEQHNMVKEVRLQIARGFVIQPSRGFGTRRPYLKIFMFRPSDDRIGSPITVKIDGAIKQGWE